MTDTITLCYLNAAAALGGSLLAIRAVRQRRTLEADNARLAAEVRTKDNRLTEALRARDAVEARVENLLAKPWVRCAYCNELKPADETIERTPNVWACDDCTPNHCNACGGYECKECGGCIPACPHSKRTKTTCKCATPNPGAVAEPASP